MRPTIKQRLFTISNSTLFLPLLVVAALVGVYYYQDLRPWISRRVLHQTTTTTTKANRVALCFAGNLRAFTLKYVYQSLLQKVVHVIEKDYPVDVFFNIKIRDEPKENRCLFNPNRTLFLQVATKLFHAVHIHELDLDDQYAPLNTTYDPSDPRFLQKPEYCDGFPLTYTPNSLFRYYQCGEIIKQYEKNHSVHYSYVYVMHPDFWLNDTIRTPKSMDNNTAYTNMSPKRYIENFQNGWMGRYPNETRTLPTTCDQIVAGHQNVMEVVFQAYTVVNDCSCYSFFSYVNPESQLMLYLF